MTTPPINTTGVLIVQLFSAQQKAHLEHYFAGHCVKKLTPSTLIDALFVLFETSDHRLTIGWTRG